MSFPKCEAAIFSVIGAKGSDTIDESGIGTVVAIRANLLITCYHVIEGADLVGLISQNPVFEGETATRVEVAGVDENLDLALLHSSIGLTEVLQLEDKETDDSTPLLVWSWPKGHFSKPSVHAAVMTAAWTDEEDNISYFSFAGRAELGMSGGVVVSALTNKIVGVVTGGFLNISPKEVAETWFLGEHPDNFDEYELRDRLEPPGTIRSLICLKLSEHNLTSAWELL